MVDMAILWLPRGALERFKAFFQKDYAEVAELVYAYVSEAYGATLESSSLSFRTIILSSGSCPVTGQFYSCTTGRLVIQCGLTFELQTKRTLDL